MYITRDHYALYVQHSTMCHDKVEKVRLLVQMGIKTKSHKVLICPFNGTGDSAKTRHLESAKIGKLLSVLTGVN